MILVPETALTATATVSTRIFNHVKQNRTFMAPAVYGEISTTAAKYYFRVSFNRLFSGYHSGLGLVPQKVSLRRTFGK